jgi:WD40 repeat protein
MKLGFVAILSLALLQKGLAQNIEIAVQKGHSAPITHISFNSNGRLLASSGDDNLIKLWHVPTGKEMASFISASSLPVTALAFDRSDDFVYAKYSDGSIHTWDIPASSLKSTSNASVSAQFPHRQEYFTTDSSHFFYIDRFYLRKKERNGNKVLFSKVPIDISNDFKSIAVSEKFGRVVAACGDGKVYVYEIGKGKQLAVLPEHLSSVNDVCLSPGDELFATASADRSIILWDTRTLKPVKRLFGKSFRYETVAFDHSGTVLAVGDEMGTARIIDFKSVRVKMSAFKLHEQKISDVQFSVDNKLLYSAGYDNRLSVFNLQNGKQEQQKKYLNYVSPGDAFQRTLDMYREPFAWLNSLSVSGDGRYVVAGGGWRESVPRRQPQPMMVWDRTTGKQNKIRAHQGEITSLAFTGDRNIVTVSGNTLYHWYYDAALEDFYFRETKFGDSTDIKSIIPLSGDSVLLQERHQLILYDLRNKKVISSLKAKREITASAADASTRRIAYAAFNTLAIGRTDSTGFTIIEAAHSDRITGMSFSPTRPVLATVSWDATVKLWNTNTGELLATFVAIGKDDHIIVTPDNFYFGTRSSLKGIGFKYGKQFVSPEQYDLRYNRPDIVLSRLGYASQGVIRSYNRAYRKRLQKMNFTEEMLSEEIHLPEVVITSGNIPITTGEHTLRFKISASDSRYKLNRLNVFVNNIPVHGVDGIDLRTRDVSALDYEVEVALSEGKNKIQVSCLNEKGVESLLETFEITSARPSRKPNLYLAVISVSRYANERMNLKYAAKDGRDLVRLINTQADIYEKIFIDTLLNENAVRENVLNLKNRFRASGVDDHVILYVSGHGLLDRNLDFFFATHDVDFENPGGARSEV